MFTHGITIYNKYSSGRLDKWYRTFIQGVHWENVSGVTLGGKSITTENHTEIVIPKVNGFITPKAYARILKITGEPVYPSHELYPDENLFTTSSIQADTSMWTLREGDFVVLGDVNIEMTDGTELNEYDDVRVVKSYDVVDYALNPMLNNITVVAQ